MNEPSIQIEINERAARAMKQAISLCLREMRRGVPANIDVDEEQLKVLDTFFSACLMEFSYQSDDQS